MYVIKLGGSLMQNDNLRDWVDCLQGYRGKQSLVIVPGGGVFADQVRQVQQQWQCSDYTSHQMAVLAMAQYALLLSDLLPTAILSDTLPDIRQQAAQSQRLVICQSCSLFPQMVDGRTGWELSSDSLGLWLARELNAPHYVLIKSVPFATAGIHWSHGAPMPAMDTDVVDKHFAAIRAEFTGTVSLFGNGQTPALMELLQKS